MVTSDELFEVWFKSTGLIGSYKDLCYKGWAASLEANKPKWEDAPDWANYLAQDSCGRWYWYKEEPIFMEDNLGFSIFQTNGFINLNERAEVTGWEYSLQQRPTKEE
jgi:hypothetical protein